MPAIRGDAVPEASQAGVAGRLVGRFCVRRNRCRPSARQAGAARSKPGGSETVAHYISALAGLWRSTRGRGASLRSWPRIDRRLNWLK